MNIFKRSMIYIFAATVSACATSPVPESEARLVSAMEAFARPFADAGILIVTRDSGFQCSLSSMRIFVDGTPAADLGTGEKAELYLTPGEHIVGVTVPGLCAGGSSSTSITIAAHQMRRYRAGFMQGGDVRVEPSAF